MTERTSHEVETLTIRIPVRLQRRGGRKLIMTPEGVAAAARKALEQRLAEPSLDGLKTPEYRGVVNPERAGSTDQPARAGHCQYQSQCVPVIRHRLHFRK